MRYDSFPLDTQVENDLQSIYVAQKKTILMQINSGQCFNFFADMQIPSRLLLVWHDKDVVHPIKQGATSFYEYSYIWIMNYSGRLAWHAYIHYLALPRCKVTWRQPIPLSSTMLLTFTSSTTRISSSAMENWATSGYCCFSLLFIFSFKNSRSFTWQIISQSINRCDSAVHIQSKNTICAMHIVHVRK